MSVCMYECPKSHPRTPLGAREMIDLATARPPLLLLASALCCVTLFLTLLLRCWMCQGTCVRACVDAGLRRAGMRMHVMTRRGGCACMTGWWYRVRLRCEHARDFFGRIGNGDAGSGSGSVGL
jgi:hypothetical protein